MNIYHTDAIDSKPLRYRGDSIEGKPVSVSPDGNKSPFVSSYVTVSVSEESSLALEDLLGRCTAQWSSSKPHLPNACICLRLNT